MALVGTSFVTTAAAATTAFSPTVTPGRIVAPASYAPFMAASNICAVFLFFRGEPLIKIAFIVESIFSYCCFIGMDSDSLVLFIQTCWIRFYMMEGVVEFVSYV